MATETAPLSITLDTTKQKTSVPMITDGHFCKVRLVKLEGTVNDGKPGTKWEFQLVDPAPTTEGGQVQPGFPLFVNIPLYDKEGGKGTAGWWLTKIAKFQDALLGTGDPGNKKGKPERPAFGPDLIPSLIGKEAIAKVKVKTGEFEGNDIASLTFPADVAA